MNTVKQSFYLAAFVTLSTTTITAMIKYNPLHTYQQLRKEKLYVTEENSSQIIIEKIGSQNKNLKKKLPYKKVRCNGNSQNLLNASVQHATYSNMHRRNMPFTELDLAIIRKDIEKAYQLLQNGADVNAKDGMGYTPLHIATQQKSMPFVHLLLGYDADATLQDEFNHYPDYYIEWYPCGGTPPCEANTLEATLLEDINKEVNKFARDSHPVLLYARLEKLLQEQQKNRSQLK